MCLHFTAMVQSRLYQLIHFSQVFPYLTSTSFNDSKTLQLKLFFTVLDFLELNMSETFTGSRSTTGSTSRLLSLPISCWLLTIHPILAHSYQFINLPAPSDQLFGKERFRSHHLKPGTTSIPSYIKSSPSVSVFRKRLKTFLLR